MYWYFRLRFTDHNSVGIYNLSGVWYISLPFHSSLFNWPITRSYHEASLYAVFSDFTSFHSGLISPILYSDRKDPHTKSSVYVAGQLSNNGPTALINSASLRSAISCRCDDVEWMPFFRSAGIIWYMTASILQWYWISHML